MSQTHCVRRDGLEPVIIKVKQNHLRFCCLQDEVSKLLHLQTGLERQLQLWPFDHNVGEVEQVNLSSNGIKKRSSTFTSWKTYTFLWFNFIGAETPHLQRVQHALPGNNDLLWLLLHRQRADQGSNFFSCLPFGQLQRQTTLDGEKSCLKDTCHHH